MRWTRFGVCSKNHLEQAFDRVMSEAVKEVREKHLRYAIVTDAERMVKLRTFSMSRDRSAR